MSITNLFNPNNFNISYFNLKDKSFDVLPNLQWILVLHNEEPFQKLLPTSELQNYKHCFQYLQAATLTDLSHHHQVSFLSLQTLSKNRTQQPKNNDNKHIYHCHTSKHVLRDERLKKKLQIYLSSIIISQIDII